MERHGGGGGRGGGGTRFGHQKSPPTERFLGIFEPPKSSSPSSPPVELSEHDIFSAPSGSSSPSPTHTHFNSGRSFPNSGRSSHNGILAALNDNLKTRSGTGSDTRPVFNHKASTSASLSSSASTSPATSTSSRISIPRRPPPPVQDRGFLRHQSAPINVPVMPAAMQRRARDLDDVVLEEEDEENDGVILPPHEVVAARDSPMLACSVLEGAGRTLKGRDLRKVRNAIWRRTGFID